MELAGGLLKIGPARAAHLWLNHRCAQAGTYVGTLGVLFFLAFDQGFCCNVLKSKSSRKDRIMIPHRSRRKGTPRQRTALRQNRSKVMSHLRVETLEERCLLSGSPPIP